MRGGKREGAGRPKGSKNKRTLLTAELKRQITESGRDPLEVMLKVMENGSSEQLRLEAAKGAAPYLHPKLSQGTLSYTDTPVDAEEATQQLAKLLSKPDVLEILIKHIVSSQEQLALSRELLSRHGLAIVPTDGTVTHISAGAS